LKRNVEYFKFKEIFFSHCYLIFIVIFFKKVIDFVKTYIRRIFYCLIFFHLINLYLKLTFRSWLLIIYFDLTNFFFVNFSNHILLLFYLMFHFLTYFISILNFSPSRFFLKSNLRNYLNYSSKFQCFWNFLYLNNLLKPILIYSFRELKFIIKYFYLC